MGSPYDPGAWRRWVNWKPSLTGNTGDPWVDPEPSATDPGMDDVMKALRDLRNKIGTPTPGETQEDVDIWQGAVDRGPGLPTYNGLSGKRMVDKPEPLTAPLGPGAYIGPTEVTLPPEVLAQLQRIEDMLKKIEVNAHRCPDCGEHNCPWEKDGLPG